MCLAETLSRIIHVFGQPQVQHVVVYLCIYCKYVYKSYMPTRMFKYICIQKKKRQQQQRMQAAINSLSTCFTIVLLLLLLLS